MRNINRSLVFYAAQYGVKNNIADFCLIFKPDFFWDGITSIAPGSTLTNNAGILQAAVISKAFSNLVMAIRDGAATNLIILAGMIKPRSR
jgi:hypothetical protein